MRILPLYLPVATMRNLPNSKLRFPLRMRVQSEWEAERNCKATTDADVKIFKLKRGT
jgi:hypothetical protein